MVVTPARRQRASPVEVMEAIVVSLLVQVNPPMLVLVVLSLYVPVAVNWVSAPPTVPWAGLGVMVISSRSGLAPQATIKASTIADAIPATMKRERMFIEHPPGRFHFV